MECGIIEISKRVRKDLCDEFKRDKQEALEKLRDIQIKLDNAEQQVEEAVAKLEKEHVHHAELEQRHQELMIQMNEYVVEQGRITKHWKICFSQLASLANGAIENVPKLLADAESAMLIFNPPKGIEAFLNHCKKLMAKMKNVMARAQDN